MKRTAPRPGDLKDTIQINDKLQTPDGYGGVIETPILYWQTYAEVKPLRSSNRLESNQETLKQVYRVTIRYRPDKTVYKNMSVTWRGDEFKILTLLSDLTDKEWVTFDIIAGNDDMIRTSVPGQDVYYGAVSSLPTTLAGLSQVAYVSPFKFESGTEHTLFVIAMYPNQSISEVLDLDQAVGSNDITDSFTLRGQVDGLNVYGYSIAVPYSSSHTFKVTLI